MGRVDCYWPKVFCKKIRAHCLEEGIRPSHFIKNCIDQFFAVSQKPAKPRK